MSHHNHEQEQQNRESSGSLALFGALTLTGLATGTGWLLFSKTMIDHNLPLPLAINAERHLFTSKAAGLLNYYVDSSSAEEAEEGEQKRPLVLIHSINAAASSYEMRPLFEYYRSQRPVYALDLPGFGFSERSNRHYTPRMYAAAIRDFLEDIVEEPADVIALSLSSEFTARAALENPEWFRSLVFLSPSGLSEKGHPQQQHQGMETGGNDLAYRLMSLPLWSRSFFDLLATKPSIRYFLNKSFHGPVDEGLVAYDYLTTHQPGAHYAPLYFVSGRLFTKNIRQEVYERLQLPSLIIYDQDPYSSFEGLPDLLLAHPNWSAVRIRPTGGLPHFEELDTTARVLNNFWSSLSE